MRILIAALLTTAPLVACSCLNTASACSAMGGSTVVFVGRVLVDSGEGWGTGSARVLVEEQLLNVPKDLKEVEINTAAGTSCYYRLKEGERYVIFAQKRDGPGVRLSIGGCSNTFRLEGNEHILDALRNKSQRGPSRLVGTVRRSTGSYSKDDGVVGAVVTARSTTNQYEALSNGFGGYEIRGMAPDRYQIEVSGPGFTPDTEYNHRWSGRMVLSKETNRIEPDKTEPPGSIVIGEKSCEVWDLSMWPRGRISGVVTSASGEPLGDVTVQAFAFDAKGKRESRPLRTGITDTTGRYVIDPLPGGEYVVGVNAEMYRDVEPYPPTVFSREKGSSAGARIKVIDGAEVADVNLALPAQRTRTTLRVQVTAPGGAPYAGAVVTLENLSGIQRWYSNERTSGDGTIEIPVYLGEQYMVKASAFDSALNRRERAYDYLGGSSRIDISRESPSVLVVLAPKWFQ